MCYIYGHFHKPFVLETSQKTVSNPGTRGNTLNIGSAHSVSKNAGVRRNTLNIGSAHRVLLPSCFRHATTLDDLDAVCLRLPHCVWRGGVLVPAWFRHAFVMLPSCLLGQFSPIRRDRIMLPSCLRHASISASVMPLPSCFRHAFFWPCIGSRA